VTPSEKPETIDRGSFDPAYIQIVRIVSQEIAEGVLQPGDQLPTEAQFRKRFNVSPTTIRRAIDILVKRGLVTSVQGKGTFVRSLDLGEAVFRLQEMKERWADGDEASVGLLEASIIPLNEGVARRLSVPLGNKCIYIRRLVLHRGVPAMYHREYLIYDPSRPIVEAQLQITSLSGLFEGQGAEGLRRGDLTMKAVNLNEEEAAALHVPANSAAFSLEHTFYDFDDRPVSWGIFICRADLFVLTARIGAEADLWGKQ
jgi:GntR family transcriptional regulator